MTIIQVKLCQPATLVKNSKILLKQSFAAHMLLLTRHYTLLLNDVIFTVSVPFVRNFHID